MNECVPLLPSLRFLKLRLYELMIEFASPSATSSRFH
jgi:hypothetical protein